MIVLLTIVHVVVCVFLIIVVLLQSGKAADLAGAFGGMGSQTAFGPRGAATLLSKATTIAAVVFMLTSITLGVLETRTRGTGQSVIERTGADQAAPAEEPAEGTPAESQPAAPVTGSEESPSAPPAAEGTAPAEGAATETGAQEQPQ